MVIDTPPAEARGASYQRRAERVDAGLPERSAYRPVSRQRRLVILVTCCLALVLAAMDVTIVNIALPAIRSDLHATVAELQWSIDGYTVVVASFLLLAGSVADRFGRTRTFQLGLAVFSVGSL